MKPIITALAVAGLFSMTACNRAELRQKEIALQAQQRTIDSMNTALAKQRVIDSMNEVARVEYVLNQNMLPGEGVAAVAPVAVATSRAATTRRTTSSTRRSTPRATSSSSTQTQPVVYQQAPAPAKKGWSAKAKGAVIGAGTGAAAGAIINGRNRAAGAVIGGVLGAGAGTGIGAVIDKKNGR